MEKAPGNDIRVAKNFITFLFIFICRKVKISNCVGYDVYENISGVFIMRSLLLVVLVARVMLMISGCINIG